jgi:phytanoyl-CoA hydroxylase
MTRLTQCQTDEFHDRGFLAIQRLIPADMVDELLVGYDEAVAGKYDVEAWRESLQKGGALQLMRPYERIPGWEGHAYMEILLHVARQLLGDDMVYKSDQMIYKPPHTHAPLLWHQDAAYGWKEIARQRSCTAWLSLATATKEMGALQFLPGSHHQGVVPHESAADKTPVGGLEASVDTALAEVVAYEAGDVTFHHGCTLHFTSSNTTDTPRRGLSTHIWPESSH